MSEILKKIQNLQTLTVRQLFEQCEELMEQGMGDRKIVHTADYGDHGHTEQVLRCSEIEEVDITASCYSDTGMAVRRNGHHEDEDESTPLLAIRFR